MSPVLYDAGPLIAAERNDRRFWAEHRMRLELAIVPCVPAPIVAQASRSPKQVQLRRLLRGCEVVPLDEAGAHRARPTHDAAAAGKHERMIFPEKS